ncbi:MAG: diacylglycerol/lipid kinase family protein [Pirellulaceae bacterium]
MTNQRVLFVVNPRGGARNGLAILKQVKPVFAEAGLALDVRVTEYAGHAREIVRTLPLQQYGRLGVVGGDGTIHEVVSGLMERGEPAPIPLGLVPAGTGNDFSKQLGITSSLEAARRIAAGRTGPFDVAKVEAGGRTYYCTTIIGWGAVADINRTAERLRMLGPSRYAFASLLQILSAKRRRARLVLDERSCEDDFLMIVACNTVFAGAGMQLTPHAKADDGKIDVVVVRDASRLTMLKLFRKVFDGTHVSMDCVEYYQVRSLAIESATDDCLDLDGEVAGRTPVRVEMMQAALQIFV